MTGDRPDADWDGAWKAALQRYFREFLELLFPAVHAEIDWRVPPVFLDKELERLVRDADLGSRRADLLVEVRLRDGETARVLVHVEVQVQRQDEEKFGERIYVYRYRIHDRFHRPVANLVVLGDPCPDWRPQRYRVSVLGTTEELRFPTAKLLDWLPRHRELLEDPNPFALFVLAHLRAQETQKDDEARLEWKWTLVRGLLERGLSGDEVRQLFRLVDWIMTLPDGLEKTFDERLERYEEEHGVQHLTSLERLGLKRGLEQGLAQGVQRSIRGVLEARFGAVPEGFAERLAAVTDASRLEALLRRAAVAGSVDELAAELPPQP